MSWLFGKKKEEQPKVEEVREVTFDLDPNANSAASFLNADLDTTKLHPMAGLDAGMEYFTLEGNETIYYDGLLPSRGWNDDLCYGTGVLYLSGLGVGGFSGLMEGLRTVQEGAPAKIKINHVLNTITKRGPFLGNSMGVLGFFYNIINSKILYDIRGKHDSFNSIAAGAIAGAIFRAPRGTKPMLIASGITAAGAGVWCVFKQAVFGPPAEKTPLE
ncbi:Tim17/Tim22/Tim23/Pmp24 family-domain-containing protein [Yarrowia lipolytica]|jgi:import inner membrane translocase subunit TIM23|uniref:YALI0F29183p n=2 Tax=Yarrowia lipolytica TaxID=4952 RepID=Q6C003_YARLI|nr:YALI0F29183p [Yarrowia lipolytica CLIB122]AOW07856.1 hypothetical protein YALI1_F36760g [Yarrowia lipolytica]KAB8279952.1 Tim17/Tim22/Tim23/Pmp24 family-domain-containing protein [Yarrowia lipolytica]KAE8168944.1 Tim17/Tim22/Tim23/Pmp24 family-domain-containing protein [Yarrowia lipolytica]KAJ8055103.1 Tim17/Tim22/Tim23/Pmp24 family-domain-containing protein [Yarrowia lipolytica]QNP99495.1 Mitochondrial import inner membrane translocase subunit TIM23 [Yarrowia lipolytica]|eukprot:XP_506009.1 YALI0F29183p [Yarrowia lipolytica CLIB122]